MTLIEQIKSNFKNKNGVYYLTEPDNAFEDIYINVRKAEGRIYNDSQVKLLPDINSSHKYYNEWMIRKRSMKMLTFYLDSMPKSKTLLELGCGNGWLTSKLAELDFDEVVGMDVNIPELEQAASVFSERANLLFAHGNICIAGLKFDYIVASSVIAYFENLKSLIDSLLTKLNTNGEIHIIDSPLYSDTVSARERSLKYYNELGYPEMSEYYHHHSPEDLKTYNCTFLYDANSLTNKIKRRLNSALSPFSWIRITH